MPDVDSPLRAPDPLLLDDDERYAAIRARDSRFDGMFVTCVRSTGIFCRPSCPARTPSRTGVEFVPSAAAAVEKGYRACKRCGPQAPPGSADADPMGSLAARALRLIEAGALDEGGSVPTLASRLSVSERTLHRALVQTTGAGALAHARLLRARRAHELVTGSDLPLAQVAYAAGFGSERQLLETFRRIYGSAPSQLRGRRRRAPTPASPVGQASGDTSPADPATGDPSGTGPASTVATTPAARLDARLSVRRPFDAEGLARWFAARAVPGVEEVRGTRWHRAVALPHGPGVLDCDLGVADGPLHLALTLADVRDYPAAVALARHLLDLDADPVGIDEGLTRSLPSLAPLVAARPGVRIPGTPTLPEALLWAITGQQITAIQARDQITRATDLLGEPLPAALRSGGIDRLPVDPLVAAQHAAQWFRGPGARRRALETAIPGAPDPTADVPALRAQLLALPGIGPWTADYALLRAVRAIDLAPRRDAALLGAARDLHLAEDHRELDALLAGAAPWRSMAVMHLWHHAAAPRITATDDATAPMPDTAPAPAPAPAQEETP